MWCCVIHSKIYVAPILHSNNKKLLSKLIRIQDRVCIRVARGNRTNMAEAVGVISISQLELLIQERRD